MPEMPPSTWARSAQWFSSSLIAIRIFMKSEAIWHPQPQVSTPLVLFRQRLNLSAAVEGAVLRVAASGPFAVYINGQLVGRGLGAVATPTAVWEGLAVDELLVVGENTVLISALGVGMGDWLRVECEITCGDGSVREMHSGTPWQTWRNDAWQSGGSAPLADSYLATREKGQWARGQIGEENWVPVAAVDGPVPRPWSPLAPVEVEVFAREVLVFGEVEANAALEFVEVPAPMRAVKFVRRETLLTLGKTSALVQTRDEVRAAYLILDFGRVLCGYPRLRLRGQEGAMVDLAFARQRGSIDGGLRYLCADGKSEWTGPQLEQCRYVVVRVCHCDVAMEVDCVSLVERRAEVEVQSRFEVAELVPVWAVGERTLEASRREVYATEPGGRRGDWLQHYVLGLNDYYHTGNTHTVGAALQCPLPPQSAEDACFYVLCAAAYHRFGDAAELASSALSDALRALAALDFAPTNAAHLALCAGAYGCAGIALREIGDGQGADQCERQRQRLGKALLKHWSAERGLLLDEEGGAQTSQWANALALYFDLLSIEQRCCVDENLRSTDARVADLWQAFFWVGGLWRAGFGTRAMTYIEQHWGRLLERQGATWAEKAGRLETLPGADALLAAYALGVAPLAAAWSVLEVRPQVDGLHRASGVLPAGAADVHVEWSLNPAGYFSLRVERSANGEMHLAIPRLGKRFPTITLNDETVWRNEKVYPNFHVREIISEDEHVVLVVHKAGRYHAELSAI